MVATLAGCAGTAGPDPASTEFEQWVNTVAAEHLRDGLVPSVSIAITRGSTVVLEKAYGRADLENDVPASNDTIYRIASITKQLTAAAILRLVEAGQVELDADVLKYLPEFHSRGRRITVRQLLNHTSGIANMTDVPAFLAKERLDLTDAEVLATFQDEPSFSFPGSQRLRGPELKLGALDSTDTSVVMNVGSQVAFRYLSESVQREGEAPDGRWLHRERLVC